jgi:hypothetical protein
MATQKITDNTSLVNEFIQQLDPALAEVVEAIRQIILSTDMAIAEQIKWNSPSFFFSGEMKLFNPKEYKRDIVVINVHKGYALLIFPTGAKVTNRYNLLEGDYKDGRRIATFHDLNEVKAKKKALRLVIKDWLNGVDE